MTGRKEGGSGPDKYKRRAYERIEKKPRRTYYKRKKWT
jgi:hypothetical protein